MVGRRGGRRERGGSTCTHIFLFLFPLSLDAAAAPIVMPPSPLQALIDWARGEVC